MLKQYKIFQKMEKERKCQLKRSLKVAENTNIFIYCHKSMKVIGPMKTE